MADQSAGSLPAADWYPDPQGQHEFRYWDGAAWTSSVSDAGQVSKDDGSPLQTVSEPVLLTLLKATQVKAGVGDPLVNVHFTSKRLIVQPLTSDHVGAMIAGGLVGRAVAANAANKKVEADSQVGTVDEILHSSDKVFAIDYGIIKKMFMRRKDGQGSVFTVNSSQKGHKAIIVKFDRELFDEASELMAGMVPGRLTLKG